MPLFAFYIYLVGLGAVVLGFAVSLHTMIVMDELRNDHRHPIGACDLLNRAILPEYVSVATAAILLLFTGQFVTTLLLIPLCLHHLYRYASRPLMSRPGIYDPTSILTVKELVYAEKEAVVKSCYYGLLMLYIAYKAVRIGVMGR